MPLERTSLTVRGVILVVLLCYVSFVFYLYLHRISMMSPALQDNGVGYDFGNEQVLKACGRRREWLPVELLHNVASFVPLEGPKLMFICRGGFTAFCNGAIRASKIPSIYFYVWVARRHWERMLSEKRLVYTQAVRADQNRRDIRLYLANEIPYNEAVIRLLKADIVGLEQRIVRDGTVSAVVREQFIQLVDGVSYPRVMNWCLACIIFLIIFRSGLLFQSMKRLLI